MVTASVQGSLSVNYSDNYYLLSQRFPEVPRLTAAHYEAMSLFNQLASSQELALQMILQPGDIQLLNNHTCLHYRSAFVDWPVSPVALHRLLWGCRCIQCKCCCACDFIRCMGLRHTVRGLS